MCWPLWQKPRPDEWQLYMLDVGQGLAMVIARNGKAILYDTGLAWPKGIVGNNCLPWLHWHNLEPEGVILSHEHLNHRGGLDSILHTWPMLWIRSPLNWEHHLPCVRGEAWQWQGLRSARTGLYKVATIKEITIPVWLRLMTGRIAFF
ncbi:MBL fold metallo-hydrolase [Escherichia coli]